jgi:hypothetical protein
MHFGGMAVDPMALHAPLVEEAASHAASHHAGHGTVSSDELVTAESAWSCMDTDGVSTPPRMPLPSVAFVAVMPVIALPVLNGEVGAPLHWVPPALDAAELRAFLQVFLN